MRFLKALALLVLLLLLGCGGGGGGSDATLSASSYVPPESIAISPPYAALANLTAGQFDAIASYTGLTDSDITRHVRVTWRSSDNTILTFDDPARPGWGRALKPGGVTITVSLDGVAGTLSYTVSSAVIQSIAVTSVVADPLADGYSRQYTAIGTFSDGTETLIQDLTEQVAWSSSDNVVATIDVKGRATAQSVGNTNLTATFTFDGVSATSTPVALTVIPKVLDSIQVTSAITPPLRVGESNVQFTATGTFSDGSKSNITNDVNWSSSIPEVATVGLTDGKVTSLSAGQTMISASKDGKTGELLLVVALPVQLEISAPSFPFLLVGENGTLTVSGIYGVQPTETTINVTTLATWTSDNDAIASVLHSGVVTANSVGMVWITATLQDLNTLETRSDKIYIDVRAAAP